MLGLLVSLLMCCTFSYAIPIVKDTFPSKSHLVLPEINIKGNALVAKRRGDTLIFTADRYKRPGALRLEQLLSNVPGFQVDPNGNISFNGRPIKKIMVDGDDLTAENYQLISRNLRSLMVDSIQVLEKYHENQLLKNLHGTNEIAVNLVLKQALYGKPKINLVAAYVPPKHGELQAELILLKQKNKQIAIFNINDVGSRPFQQQSIQQQALENKQQLMFRSWPVLLNHNLSSNFDDKYVNQNGDWSFSVATSIKLKQKDHLRINMGKSTNFVSSALAQHQLFFSIDTPIRLFSSIIQQQLMNKGNVILYREVEKENQKRTVYEFEGYLLKNINYNKEVRTLTQENQLNANTDLNANGFRFKIEHTKRTGTNDIWQWEAIVNGSANYYRAEILRNDVLLYDSIYNVISQMARHNGLYGQLSVGHIRSTKNNIIRYWLRTSLPQLCSNQHNIILNLRGLKTFTSIHLTSVVSKKINFDMQTMFGYAQMNVSQNLKHGFIYHLDHDFTWKPKPTRQLNLKYGILKQETDLRRFFAGSIFSNATVKVSGPAALSFPVTLYSQLHFSLLDLYRGINVYAQLMIKNINRDYYMATSLGPYNTTLSHLIAKRQYTASFNFQFEKLIHPVRIKYRLLFGLLHLNGPAQFNSQKFIAINTFSTIGQHISTNWRKGYNLQFEHHQIQSKLAGMSSNTFRNYRNEYKIILELYFSHHLNAHLVLHRYNGKGLTPLDVFDIKMNCSPNSKYRFFINGNNLLNKKIFIQQTISHNSISTTSQQLIGRRIFIGVDIPL